jgi:hypothetical protein
VSKKAVVVKDILLPSGLIVVKSGIVTPNDILSDNILFYLIT